MYTFSSRPTLTYSFVEKILDYCTILECGNLRDDGDGDSVSNDRDDSDDSDDDVRHMG